MGFRDHGYYGYAFIGVRPLQIISLIVVVGMVSNFISEDSRAHISAPSQLVGTLVIACLALLWTLLSFTAYDDTHFPYVATSALDVLFMIPFIVIAAIFGGPLSSTTCSDYPTVSESSAHSFLGLPVGNGDILLVGGNQSTCNQIMAVWGFVISLCVLFALSAFAAGLLFLGKRRALAASETLLVGKSIESQIELAAAQGKDFVSDPGYPPYASTDLQKIGNVSDPQYPPFATPDRAVSQPSQ
ncbi:hypothetical protein CMQ_392 [Grosmannia clavigera kw1407]|uniref:MARVEL domain-containing protein n=1 Tax=Grosmannia clavigera (strain kw1407 / UAMH 11150) TaxID=655863 RepID=F0XCW3_GROCL|nr:uncharacterized protein CMQ_392 [Grosmannia clavigera kw1407]EFX03464.1 hypothetical protein CMQ_392 [Grosmannia clavigera kw1407]